MHRTKEQENIVERINSMKKGDELIIMLKEWEKAFKTYLPVFLHSACRQKKHVLYKKKFTARTINKKYYILRQK